MDWTDEGIVLAARRHGESAAVCSLLTAEHGRHAGLVRGGAGRRQRGVLQPGNRVRAHWRARLPEHLGTYTVELCDAGAARVIDDPARLAALSAACALSEAALPEREPHGRVYNGLCALLESLSADEGWAAGYVAWELALLGDLGFGLDLGSCAATGRNDQLAYVSPKSGRAVSLAAGEPYRDRLLALPAFLIGGASAGPMAEDVAAGLRLTGHFLEHHVLAPAGRGLPPARRRFVERVAGPGR